MSVGFIKFDDILNEKLKDPEFKKGYEYEKEKFELELKFNEMLREMGREDLFVEVKDMSEY
jgi:hypothetical protein